MAIDNKRIKVNELDFDAIKANLKNYLRGQSQFSDYDFDGAGMNILLDVLAYNTHYNALYTNLAINEMFLDSASKRSSLASISALMGYTPKSITSASAIIDLTLSNVPGNPSTLTIPSLQSFNSSIIDTTGTSTGVVFYSRSSYTASRSSSNTYVFKNVVITEGKPMSYKYVVGDNVRYIIPNANVDMSTLLVRVQESAEVGTYTSYSPNLSITNSVASTRVYYTKEIEDGLYEVYFGDNIVSYKPNVGNIVNLEYFISKGDTANGAKIFNYQGYTAGGNSSCLVVQAAGSGSEQESNDSIRFNAPKQFAAQNRTVTAEDYKTLIPKVYPNTSSISVWGGEENDPPIYGKVFICIKPLSGTVLSQAAKDYITGELLSSRNVVSITPTIVDPRYLNILLDVSFYYNPLKTRYSADGLTTIVRQAIAEYNATEIKNFDSVFRLSRLQRMIDTSEAAITNSVVKVKLSYDLDPNYNYESAYTISLHNPIYNEPGSTAGSNINTTGFTLAGSTNTYFFDDDTQGNLRIYYLSTAGIRIYTSNKAGIVDYVNGKIIVNSINISTAVGNTITFTVEPSSYDVISVRNQLVTISENKSLIYPIVDKIDSGESSSGMSYIFTPNR
jgi:hypothetical protein